MSETPRTDAAIRNSDGQWSYTLRNTCQQLERELAEALYHRAQVDVLTAERDTLSEALECLMQSCESIDCEGFMPASMPDAYDKAKQALDAVEGGSHE
jgi:hypothetical protein